MLSNLHLYIMQRMFELKGNEDNFICDNISGYMC